MLLPEQEKPVDQMRPSLHPERMNILSFLRRQSLLATLLSCALYNVDDAAAQPLSPAANTQAGSGSPVVIGYFLLEPAQLAGQQNGSLRASDIRPDVARQLTHINFAFMDINAKGECDFEAGTDARQAVRALTQLQALKRHQPGLRILYSLGGWTHTNDDSTDVERYRQAAATPEARSKLIRSCVSLMQRYRFDGVDIDWEYPRAQDAAAFTDLLREFRQALNQAGRHRARPYQLTIAAAGGAFNMARTYAAWPAIAASVDYINLMTYDLNGSWEKLSNHQAHLFGEPGEALYDNPLRALAAPSLTAAQLEQDFPARFALTVDAAVQQYLVAGVPAHKLVLGFPFYGRALFQVGADKQGLHQRFVTPAGDHYQGDVSLLTGCPSCVQRGDPRLPAYADLQAMLAGSYGYQPQYSEISHASWLWHPQQHIFVSADDARAVQAKVAYLRHQGLAGAMFWHLGQDAQQATLLSQLHTALYQQNCQLTIHPAAGVYRPLRSNPRCDIR